MNAGIVMLQDGTPCIAYDERLPFPIHHIEFCRGDFQISFVYDAPKKGPGGSFMRETRKFEFPLDHPFVKLLEERGNVAVAYMNKTDLLEIKVYPVIFTH